MSGECDSCGENHYDCWCKKDIDSSSTERYFNRNGQLINRELWSILIAEEEYKRIASNSVGEYIVSTIWTGYDKTKTKSSKKKRSFRFFYIFETMVFKNGHILEQEKHLTEAAAFNRHNELVTKYFLAQEFK